MDVSLGDLYCEIPAWGAIDLSKIPHLDLKKIQDSYKSGSLGKRLKSNTLKFGGVPPKPIKKVIEVSNLPLEARYKGGIIVEPDKFDEDDLLNQTNKDDLAYIEDLLNEEELWTPKK